MRKRRKGQHSTTTTITNITNEKVASTTITTNIIINNWMPSSAADKLVQIQQQQQQLAQQHQYYQQLSQQQKQQQSQQQTHTHKQQQQQSKRPRPSILNGFPLNFSTLLATLSILHCSAANPIETQQQQQYEHQQQQQQQQELHLAPQPQHQQQNNLLAVMENSLESSNHTFKSFSHTDLGVLSAETLEGSVAAMEQQPVFDFGMPRNITARTGQAEAAIKCRVAHLNDKSVSWIRKRDLHILTVATSTYTSDKRFEVTSSKDEREWTLHVKSPQARDSGIYECQVNTEPKMSMAFQLNIIVTPPDARAVISGPADLHFKVGSAIILNCIVEQPSFKDIGPIYWYRGEQMLTPLLNELDEVDAEAEAKAKVVATVAVAVDDTAANNLHNSAHAGITNDIESDFKARIAMESQLGDTLKSRLRISNAQTTDTGNYSCQPTTASSASVMIHVINDENPAAMQKSKATALYPAAYTDAPPLCRLPIVVALLLMLLLRGGIDRLIMLNVLSEAIYFLFTTGIISR